MATVTGQSGLDMRELIFLGEIVAATETRIAIAFGDRTGSFDGAFSYGALGLPQGTLHGFSLRENGATVFETTGVERSAYTAIGIARSGDNDRFLAYTLSDGDRLEGTAGADYLLGFGGNDAAFGRGGDDDIFGGSDDDRLYGGAGSDLLAGGEGVDRLSGGSGDDTYIADATGDFIVEARGDGWDIALASASYVLPEHVEELGLTGTEALDGRGNGTENVVRGNTATNMLRGRDGDDALSGLGGDDVLIGGRGRDLLSGGYGDDVYSFRSRAESGPGASQRDRILEFWSGQDRIDLTGLDARPERPGDQAFAFRGTAAFSGAGGELRVSAGRISADIDGDRRADFAVDLYPPLVLERDDFIL